MIVLDAAALVDVVADQPPKPWVLDRIEGEELVAPAHQLAEVLSAIARLERAGILSADAARDAIGDAGSLRQEFVVLTVAHLQRARELQERVRVLDGLYVALAEERGATLVTTDERLARSGMTVPIQTPGTTSTGQDGN